MKRQRVLTAREERELRTTIGLRIQSAREDAEVSRAELAAPFFTRAFIGAIERGERLPSLITLTHIAARLDISVRDLLTEADEDDETDPLV